MKLDNIKSEIKKENWGLEKTPQQIVNFALEKLDVNSFYVGYSGGKDSGIVLDLIAREYPKYFKGVIYVNTGIGTAATRNFVKNICDEKKYPLFELSPASVQAQYSKYLKKGESFTYENLIKTFGFPDKRTHNQTMAWLKFYPMKQFINSRIAAGEKPALISGVRKNESARRKYQSNYTKAPIDKAETIIFVKPIYYKTNSWVSEFWIKNNMKRSPCYDTIGISGDCLCGCFSDSKELKLLETYHPDVFNKIKELEKSASSRSLHWGNSKKTTTNDIEKQTTFDVEENICNECHFNDEINPLLRLNKNQLDIILNESPKKISRNQKKIVTK